MTTPVLSQSEFDDLCEAFMKRALAAHAANDLADEAKARVLAYVTQHGYVPANAEKSRRFDGREYIGTVTTGTSVEVNHAVATELELLLSHIRLPQVFQTLFARTVKYSLVKGADEVMKGAAFPRRHAERIRSLWSQCFTVKANSPALKVEFRELVDAKAAKKAKKAVA